jgi:hypothetical protein
LSEELLVVLCFVFWFWFLSFSLLLLLVQGSYGYRHNNWRPPFVLGSSNKPRMSTRKKRTTANSTKVRTMCGSRTGGWSLPCVMSDCNVVWTDSWLSIAGTGCGLTGVGAGEEQARKVIAGEASRCGEDK